MERHNRFKCREQLTTCRMPRPHLRNLQQEYSKWGSENSLEGGTGRLQEAVDKDVCGKLSSMKKKLQL